MFLRFRPLNVVPHHSSVNAMPPKGSTGSSKRASKAKASGSSRSSANSMPSKRADSQATTGTSEPTTPRSTYSQPLPKIVTTEPSGVDEPPDASPDQDQQPDKLSEPKTRKSASEYGPHRCRPIFLLTPPTGLRNW